MAKRPQHYADLAVEEQAFREAVQDYLKTGESSLLTTKEKSMLDKARPKASMGGFTIRDPFPFSALKSFFYK